MNEMFYTVKEFLGEKYLTQRARISHAATVKGGLIDENCNVYSTKNIEG